MKKLLAVFMILWRLLNVAHSETIGGDTLFKTPGESSKNIIGYYAAWQMYDRSGLCKPENLYYQKYTILNYAFFSPDSIGNIEGTDYWADSILLRGEIDWSKSSSSEYYYFPHSSLIDLAHVYGVKVMVSIGGWGHSRLFPSIAADPVKRARFASACVKAIKTYQFDGIDIDWEFPGYAEHNGTSADKENFTLLMQAIRDSIDSLGKKINYKFLLSGAFGQSKKFMDDIDWKTVAPLLDMINLMSYDYGGTWSEVSSHNCPLHSPAQGDPLCLDMSFKFLTDSFLVPPSKINIGVNFNGHSLRMKEKASLHGKNEFGEKDMVTFAVDEGSPVYYNIIGNMEKFNAYWDSTAQVPYLLSKQESGIHTFVSYDDPRSIRMKANYVVENQAGGVLIWEVSGDYIETKPGSGRIKATPLVDQIVEAFSPMHYKKTIKKRWEY